MINTEKTFDNNSIAYEVLSDGYEIYLGGKLWISQRGQYGKPIFDGMTYKENCLAQIEEITAKPDFNVDGLLEEVSKIE